MSLQESNPMGLSEMELLEIEQVNASASGGSYEAMDKLIDTHIPRLISALREARADSERMNWLGERSNFFRITPATNRVGVIQGWTFCNEPLDFLNRVGERCADIREAIDRARAAVDGRDEK